MFKGHYEHFFKSLCQVLQIVKLIVMLENYFKNT